MTPPKEYRFKGYKLRFADPIVMGILNVTPDSFSDGGKFIGKAAALLQASRMAREGAGIIDVGGESSRPGAKAVPLDEELLRTVPVVKAIVKKLPSLPISIDTYKPQVAKAAIEAGAAMINDITGLRNPEMVKIAAITGIPVVIMHMKGDPATMQKRPRYKEVVSDIISFFEERIELCKKEGIDKIILDPGIGFGKTRNHNLEILKRLDEITALGFPVLVGLSRKSFIGKSFSKVVMDREIETLAANAIAISKGAKIIRVHEVGPNAQAAAMAGYIDKGINLKKSSSAR